MKELLDKLSSYNIFNYLFPGVIFAVIANKITHYSFTRPDVLSGAFLYYFIGLVISRFGSLVLEPLLKRFSFVKLEDYRDLALADKKDQKIDVLLEASNVYRTLTALCLGLLLLKVYEQIEYRLPVLRDHVIIAIVAILLVVFLFAYRKQTNYVTERIKVDQQEKTGDAPTENHGHEVMPNSQ